MSLVTIASAWSGPQLGTVPPNNNASAPLNLGTVGQIKDGDIGANSIMAFGNMLLNDENNDTALKSTITYLNFSDLTVPVKGVNGYGIRDNAGSLEFKNSGGSWATLQSSFATWITNSSPTFNTVTATQYCITAGSCISSWPSAGFTGSGSTNYVPLFTGATSLGNSIISQSAGQIAVAGTNASASLYVTSTNASGWAIEGVGNSNGVYGDAPGAGIGVEGQSSTGWGVEGIGKNGVYGQAATAGGVGMQGYNAATGDYADIGYSTYALYGVGNLYVSGSANAASFLYNSDERLKKDIAPLTGNLSKVLALKPVTYQWRDPKTGTGPQIGFIAQQVQEVEPVLVHTDASTTLESVDYARMTPLLVGSVQELDKKIADQQQEIDMLKAEVQALLNK